MKILRKTAIAIFVATGIMSASAIGPLDTGTPSRLFSLGARIGINTAKSTIRNPQFNQWNNTSWGTGFEIGAVVDINIRNYIAIQPGAFIEYRGWKYAFSGNNPSSPEGIAQFGKLSSTRLTIPVVASFRIGLSNILRLSADLGPYLSFRMGGADNLYNTDGASLTTKIQQRGFEWGFKVGAGINLLRHYYFGVHYLGAVNSPWENAYYDGHAKTWTFTLGYDF